MQWNNVRKGAIYGTFRGWSFLIITVVYSTGIFLGLLLMHYLGYHKGNISDTLVVCYSIC